MKTPVLLGPALLFCALLPYARAELPPGFKDPTPPANVKPWDPSPGSCTVVYSPSLKLQEPYRIVGGGNPVGNDTNYFFYFPREGEVLSFITPDNATHAYPKGTLDAHYGIAVDFRYPGGFPPGFQILGPLGVLGGKVTYPVPGDKWARVVVNDWPFIRRPAARFDFPKHCTFNKDCICLRS
jgi:hypothetical protein